MTLRLGFTMLALIAFAGQAAALGIRPDVVVLRIRLAEFSGRAVER